ncbi:MAG: DJ-1/PfpI family protein [Candidatus Micrarchaeaceae archaeon]
MRLLVFITPKDFRDETVSEFKLFFDKWEVEYKIGSYTTNDCVGYHGAAYKPDINVSKVSALDFDGIVLVDGNGIESYKMYEYRPLLDLVMKFNDSRKHILAVGNAVKILARANVINGKRIAIPDDAEIKRLVILFHGVPAEENASIADNLITIKDSNSIEESMGRVLSHMGVS